jgi:hypothetical protein
METPKNHVMTLALKRTLISLKEVRVYLQGAVPSFPFELGLCGITRH